MVEHSIKDDRITQVTIGNNTGGIEEPISQIARDSRLESTVAVLTGATISTSIFHNKRQTTRRNNQQPRFDDSGYCEFRKLCNQIVDELKKIDDFVQENEVAEEALEVIVEVEALLEQLYDCPWGKGESLKRIVVAIESQVNNVVWNSCHIAFLKECAAYLKVRYLIDEQTVDDCYDIMKSHGLDPFRGTVSGSDVVKQYRIEEVNES